MHDPPVCAGVCNDFALFVFAHLREKNMIKKGSYGIYIYEIV